MPFKARGRGTDYEEIDRFDGGVGWIAHPEEGMRRASHALATENGVYAVDPVDADGVDDLFAEFGGLAGTVVLMDRHARDAAAIADRHDVPVYVPSFVDPEIETATQPVSGALPGSDYGVVRTVDWPGWDEAALWDGETLVVGDALGTTDYFKTADERLGVHPLLRISPPRRLGGFQPERILVGHGEGVLSEATTALDDALDGARRRAPKVWLNGLKQFL
ncbi:MAG: hypothetical protein ABEH83_10285 [Halobacterium sp.]